MSIIANHICICGRCEKDSNNRVFVARGARTEYRLNNPQNKIIDKLIVDDCLLHAKNTNEKCDYLFIIHINRQAHFVECKGSDVLKAVDQIASSVRILYNDFRDFIIKGRIVPTKVYAPDLRTQSFRRLREKLKGELEVQNNSFSEIA